MSDRLTGAQLSIIAGRTTFSARRAMARELILLRAEIARLRAADAQPAPDVDAVLLRESRDIETATGRACPSCGFAPVTEGASKSHDWYCDHCQGYGNWDGSV